MSPLLVRAAHVALLAGLALLPACSGDASKNDAGSGSNDAGSGSDDAGSGSDAAPPATDCGPSPCGACGPGCDNINTCTANGWRCSCSCSG